MSTVRVVTLTEAELEELLERAAAVAVAKVTAPEVAEALVRTNVGDAARREA